MVHAAAQDRGLKAIVLDGLGQSGIADLPPPTTFGEFLLALQRAVTFETLRARGVSNQPVIESLSRVPLLPTLIISGAGQDLEREAVRRYFTATSAPKEL